MIVHRVVSGDGFRLLLVLVFGAEGRNSADRLEDESSDVVSGP